MSYSYATIILQIVVLTQVIGHWRVLSYYQASFRAACTRFQISSSMPHIQTPPSKYLKRAFFPSSCSTRSMNCAPCMLSKDSVGPAANNPICSSFKSIAKICRIASQATSGESWIASNIVSSSMNHAATSSSTVWSGSFEPHSHTENATSYVRPHPVQVFIRSNHRNLGKMPGLALGSNGLSGSFLDPNVCQVWH